MISDVFRARWRGLILLWWFRRVYIRRGFVLRHKYSKALLSNYLLVALIVFKIVAQGRSTCLAAFVTRMNPGFKFDRDVSYYSSMNAAPEQSQPRVLVPRRPNPGVRLQLTELARTCRSECVSPAED